MSEVTFGADEGGSALTSPIDALAAGASMPAESTAIVSPPDLARPVTLLASHVQNAMVAIYNLHRALVRIPNITKDLPALLEQFKRSKDIFRSECESVRPVLQLCYGHATANISLRKLPLTHAVSEYLPMAEDVLADARKVYRELKNRKIRYDTSHGILKKHEAQLRTIIMRHSQPLRPTGEMSRAERRWTSTSNSPGGNETVVAGTIPFVDVSTLSESYAALEGIGASLVDLLAFWEDHIIRLAAVASEHVELPCSQATVQKEINIWKGYQLALINASSSISDSTDAMIVDPIVSSSRGTQQQPTLPESTKPTVGDNERFTFRNGNSAAENRGMGEQRVAQADASEVKTVLEQLPFKEYESGCLCTIT